jgi:hypothetical protein
VFDKEIKLRTRSECERVCERIANWLKAGKIDPNLGNAMLNAVGKVLSSKTATEEMELKVADRELLARLQEMDARQQQIEDALGGVPQTDAEGKPRLQ